MLCSKVDSLPECKDASGLKSSILCIVLMSIFPRAISSPFSSPTLLHYSVKLNLQSNRALQHQHTFTKRLNFKNSFCICHAKTVN